MSTIVNVLLELYNCHLKYNIMDVSKADKHVYDPLNRLRKEWALDFI